LTADIAHQQKAPRLHETHRRGEMGSGQQARQHIVRDRIGHELAAHVAAGKDGLVNGGADRGRVSIRVGWRAGQFDLHGVPWMKDRRRPGLAAA
jgi:hypothetical protein